MQEYNSCINSINDCIENKYFSIAHLYFEEKPQDIHIHDCYEIYYSMSGGEQFMIDNKSYIVNPGDVFFINQYENHHLTHTNQDELERIIISIHPEFLKEISTNNTSMDYCFNYREDGFCHRISLDNEQQQRFIYFKHKLISLSGFGADVMERAVFTELMVFFNKLFYANVHSKKMNEAQYYKYDNQVSEILDYINQNIECNLNLDHLSETFFLSKSYICRIFKESTGTTINRYITARRISIAKSLLSEGMNVKDVYEQCGYRDYSNFLKAFTKSVGVSPKKYSLYSSA